MKFFSRTNKRPTEATQAGQREQQVYAMAIDAQGHKYLEEDHKIDIYEKIQASLEETKIENIIRRAVGGDATALNTMHGLYADVTAAPKSLAEMQQMVIAATTEFNKLPLEVRLKFNQSPEQYIAEYGSEEWVEKMKQPEVLQAVKETKEVETDE